VRLRITIESAVTNIVGDSNDLPFRLTLKLFHVPVDDNT
jgi:hypothetical protein